MSGNTNTVTGLYAIMGVSQDASEDDIRKAYKRLCLKLHPDRVKDDDKKQEAKEAFVAMKNAYDILMDPEKRRTYNETSATTAQASSQPSNATNNQGSTGSSSKSTNQENERKKEASSPRNQTNTKHKKQEQASSEPFKKNEQFNAAAGGGTTFNESKRSSHGKTKSHFTGAQGARKSSHHTFASKKHEFAGWSSSSSSRSKSPVSNRFRTQSNDSCDSFASAHSNNSFSSFASAHSHESNRNKSKEGCRSRKTRVVYGMNKTDGLACKRCLQQGGFCWQHKDQDPKEAPKLVATARTFGIRQDGQPCLRCRNMGGYCYQHENQNPMKHNKTKASAAQRPPKPEPQDRVTRSSRNVCGITKNGTACKRCLKQGGLCYQHR